MRNHIRILLLTVSLPALPCSGAILVTTGGLGVTTSTDSANFESISGDLSAYTEGQLTIALNSTKQSFSGLFGSALEPYTSGYFYGNATQSFVSISHASESIYELSFLLGSGFFAGPSSGLPVNLRWQAYSSGIMVDSGTLTGLNRGIIAHWESDDGFDELRVAAADLFLEPGFGNSQAIAIDNLNVSTIPEPASAFLLGMGSLMAVALRRRIH